MWALGVSRWLGAIAVLLGLAAPAAANPLQTPACQRALEALTQSEQHARQAVSSDAAASQAGERERLRAARQGAARECLRAQADEAAPAARRPSVPAALAVPPVAPDAPAAAVPVPRATGPAPGATSGAAPLRSIAGCDALGCWASDGTRLQRIGTQLLGPHGYCTETAGVLTCP
jgi:hypothetical protein